MGAARPLRKSRLSTHDARSKSRFPESAGLARPSPRRHHPHGDKRLDGESQATCDTPRKGDRGRVGPAPASTTYLWAGDDPNPADQMNVLGSYRGKGLGRGRGLKAELFYSRRDGAGLLTG